MTLNDPHMITSSRDPRRHRHHAVGEELAHRSAAAHAHEQPRPGRGRASRGTRGLWRHRPRGARLGELRSHRRNPETPRGRSDAAHPVRQSRSGVFTDSCRRAARVVSQLQPGAALEHLGALQRARSQGTHDVRPDDGRLVDLHRLAGHRAGHLRNLRRDGPPALRRQSRGPLAAHRRPGRHGRRAAAGVGDGRRVVPRHRMPALAHRHAPEVRLPRSRHGRRRRGAGADRPLVRGKTPGVRRPARQRGRDSSRAFPARRAARSADRSDLRARSHQRLSAHRLDRGEMAGDAHHAIPPR